MTSETEIYKRQSFGGRMGMGQRPALLIVDFVNGFCDPDVFGGGNIGPAIEKTAELLKVCRELDVPVVFTRIVFADDGSDHNLMCLKVPQLKVLTEDAPEAQIVAELAPRPGELIVRKRFPSAFFGTDLTSWFAMHGIDTALITGCTTSGCVRASVLDAMCWGFRPIVVRDCVGDRAMGPHEANLFDLEQKYADVVPADTVIAELTQARGAVAKAAG